MRIYLNQRKKRSMISPTGYDPITLYDASDTFQHGWAEFVDRETFDKFVQALKELKPDHELLQDITK